MVRNPLHRFASDRRSAGRGPLSSLRTARGGISYLTLFLLLVVAAAAYLGYTWFPHWLTNRRVVSAMREAAYQAWRIQDDDALRRMIREKTDRLVIVQDESGDHPAIDEGMIEIERSDELITIDLAYEVPMRFPGTNQVRWISFENSVQTDLRSPTLD